MLNRLLQMLGIQIETLDREEAAKYLLRKEVTFEYSPKILYHDDSDRSDRLHHLIAPGWVQQQYIH